MGFLETLVATSVGALLGFAGSYFVSRVERNRIRRDELRRATAAYQAQIASAISRLRELPSAREPGLLGQAIDRVLGEQEVWARTQKGLLETVGPDWRQPIELALASGAQVRLMGPPSALLEAMDRAEDYVSRLAVDRTDELRDEWSSVHRQLAEAAELTPE